MNSSYDVVIIGGGIMGSAAAYYLLNEQNFGGSVLVIERDPTYRFASTTLSASSIRTQFSNAINVQISQYGLEVIRNFRDLIGDGHEEANLQFHESGYLYLAQTDAQAEILRQNHEVQRAMAADVVLWAPDELARAFPHLNSDDLVLASYGMSGEGWFDSSAYLNGFRRKAQALGAEFAKGEVVGLIRDGRKITTATLDTGATVTAGYFVNTSGPRASRIAEMAGLNIPVEPRKRTVFVFDCANSPEGSANVANGRLPLLIDTSGVWCRPEGRYFLTACAPDPDPAVEPDDFDPRYDDFEEVIWPALAHRSKSFEAIKVINQWAGHYAYNTLDQNMILGAHPDVENLIFANGFSGHGLQQAPATGRAVSELIVHGGFRTLDLSPFGFDRILAERPFLERCVI